MAFIFASGVCIKYKPGVLKIVKPVFGGNTFLRITLVNLIESLIKHSTLNMLENKALV